MTGAPKAPEPWAIVLPKRGKLGPCGACAYFNRSATRHPLATGKCHFAPPTVAGRPVLAAVDPGCASFAPKVDE